VDIPMIPVEGRNHATLISDPDPNMVEQIVSFLDIADADGYGKWLEGAKTKGEPALAKMLVNPGKDAAGLPGDIKAYFGHLFHLGGDVMDGWQQFVVHARDERGDPVTDYLVDVLRQEEGKWVEFAEMYTDVHAYGADASFRCFHIRLPKGIAASGTPLQIRITASTGTALMAYQGYGSDEDAKTMTATAGPVIVQVNGLGDSTLFYPFTTTLVELILNREPFPLNDVSDIFRFLPPGGLPQG
jgi:hypothetical protein